MKAEGWLVDVVTERIAHQLVEDVLNGVRDGVVVRGTQVAPGIWRARGALVVEGATLLAPCYLATGSFIADGAVLGPGAVIGEHAIVERGARVRHARIAAGVVVGQGVAVRRGLALGGRIVRHGGRLVVIEDPLLIGEIGTSRGMLSKLAAAAALAVAAPAAAMLGGAAATVSRRLGRIVDGTGSWVGVRDLVDPDAVAVDLLPCLVPADALDPERLAARAIYKRQKDWSVDAKLLVGRLAIAARSFL